MAAIDREDFNGCLVVTGMPGAGKTTVTKLVAAALPRAARLDGDTVAAMIASGHVGPLSQPRDEAKRQLLLRAKNISTLANNFAAAGFTPVLDHVVPDRAILSYMASLLEPRPLLFVVLSPSLEVCQQRNMSRDPMERVPYDYSFLDREMRDELGDFGWWLDSSELTPEPTAKTVLAQAHDRAAVGSIPPS